MLFKSKRQTVVMNISSQSVTLLVGTKNDNGILSVSAFVEDEYAGFADGQWLEEYSLENAVYRAFERLNTKIDFKIRKLYVGIPAEFTSVVTRDVFVRFEREKRINARDVDYLASEGKPNLDGTDYFVCNTSTLRYYLNESGKSVIAPCGSTAYKLGATLCHVLCQKSFARQIEDLLATINICEVKYVSSAWAEPLSLMDRECRDMPICLIDLGYLSTSIAVASGDGLHSLNYFSIGGAHLAGDIFTVLGENYNLTFEQAQQLVDKTDLNMPSTETDLFTLGDGTTLFASEVSDIVESRLQQIGEIIHNISIGFEVPVPEYLPFYITGDGIGRIRGAKEVLENAIGRKLQWVAPKLPSFSKPNYSAAVSVLNMACDL